MRIARACPDAFLMACVIVRGHAWSRRVGVCQIGEAVTNRDQATQQNAALVEEMAAAASIL